MFRTEPQEPGVHMVSNVHDIAAKAQEENWQSYVSDCMEVLLKADAQWEMKIKITGIVHRFRESNLNLLISHKEGGFVRMTRESFLDKVQFAIDKKRLTA